MSSPSQSEEAQLRAIPLKLIQERMVETLEGNSEKAVADAVDIMLSQAAFHGGSDIHLEPWSDYITLRYRVDGILQQVALIPREYQARITARIKVLSELVVYRKDVPQDGRIDGEKTSCGRPMRVSTVPTIKGENVVVRLLGGTHELYGLETLGFQPAIVGRLRDIITRSQGTLLLTGPSSSGKTTTIYSLLREMIVMQRHSTNIITIEDPVEYSMDKISQIQVNPHVDFTFATALRNILRQDPEVIMVGEIRDFETARMAIQAGLTGHFVISTIHSGTAAGVFTRLLDMGIEPFLVASSISGVIAQRLVRLNCTECTKPYKPESIMLSHFGIKETKARYFRGQGCPACQSIGYRGRAAIGELLLVNQAIAELVLTQPTTTRIHESAVAAGMQTMAEDGVAKAQKGITTLDELVRVLPTL